MYRKLFLKGNSDGTVELCQDRIPGETGPAQVLEIDTSEEVAPPVGRLTTEQFEDFLDSLPGGAKVWLGLEGFKPEGQG
jgi:hypothetical protein